MKNIKNYKHTNTILNILFIGALSFVMVFTRSFMGLYFLGFRLGELVVAFGLILILFNLFRFNSIEFKKTYYLLFSLTLSFLISLFVNGGSLLDTYTYKSSSYIWLFGYFWMGYLIFKNLEINNIFLAGLVLIPIVIYIFNSGNYPDFIINFFKRNSDKFQFIKGSDVLMAFIFCTFLLKKYLKKKTYYMTYLNLIGGLLLPLLLTLSRASFFSCTLFVILENLNNFKWIKNNIKKYFLIFLGLSILFILSSIRLSGLPEINRSEPVAVVQESVEEVVKRKNTNQFFGLYVSEGRLKSKDNTLEWRFDIWQDLIDDLNYKGKIVFGFGFNEIFEIMKDPTAPGRLGREGLNEHVHNHLFTVLGRMGLIGLFIYFVFQFNLLKLINSKELFIFFTPLLLVSLMDTTMESVQFPLLYYVLISISYTKK